jgi:hypothetical protein
MFHIDKKSLKKGHYNILFVVKIQISALKKIKSRL